MTETITYLSLNLRMPYTPQGKKSANCGPCSLKMLADYYSLTKPNGPAYSVAALNRLCRVSREWGTDISDINRALKRIGLRRKKISIDHIPISLEQRKPILTVFMDEENTGHYAIIKGLKVIKGRVFYIFHDPYWGKNTIRSHDCFQQQLKRFNYWMCSIST